MYLGQGRLCCQRQGDAAAARSDVHDEGFGSWAEEIQGRLDQDLRLRPRDQDVRVDAELVSPEGLNAGQVLQRPPLCTRIDE